MTLSTSDTVRLLVALVALLIAAHGTGYIFRRLRQPPVIGEILGGLLLGPTLFGRLLPGWYDAVFAPGTATPVVLGAVYQLGLKCIVAPTNTGTPPQPTAPTTPSTDPTMPTTGRR